MDSSFPNLFLLVVLLLLSLHHSSAAITADVPIGINYGTIADNLPSPAQVAAFLTTQTTITHVKIFDSNLDILAAFANTNISLTIAIPDDAVLPLSQPDAARSWLANTVLPYYPTTKIRRILVGNEIIATKDKDVVSRLLAAMRSIHSALVTARIADRIQVSTPHSLGILSGSEPPSSGRFRRGYDRVVFTPILDFHRQTKTPFMICPYPFYGYTEQNRNYTLFLPNDGVFDKDTGLTYTNLFDAQMDAVYSAMKRVGYGDVDIVVAETGWPSVGDPGQTGFTIENAMLYNSNLVKHLKSGLGTPLMPNRTFETYIFSLFNEDLKPSTTERNFGLFRPNFEPVYDLGILRNPNQKKWCVPKIGARDEDLQANLAFACGSSGVDCRAIEEGGDCFDPNNVRSHAAYAMNAYYQLKGWNDFDCDFSGTGFVTSSDPSYQECAYGS